MSSPIYVQLLIWKSAHKLLMQECEPEGIFIFCLLKNTVTSFADVAKASIFDVRCFMFAFLLKQYIVAWLAVLLKH